MDWCAHCVIITREEDLDAMQAYQNMYFVRSSGNLKFLRLRGRCQSVFFIRYTPSFNRMHCVGGEWDILLLETERTDSS